MNTQDNLKKAGDFIRTSITVKMAAIGILILSLLVSILPVQAEIFKCTLNGKIQFTDHPCADNAQKIELKVRHPDTEAVSSQQQITQQFKEDTRVNAVHSLREEIKALKSQVSELEQQRDAELNALKQKTYQIDENSIGTREPGLFQQINDVLVSYRQKIEQVQLQIKQDQMKLDQLHQQALKN